MWENDEYLFTVARVTTLNHTYSLKQTELPKQQMKRERGQEEEREKRKRGETYAHIYRKEGFFQRRPSQERRNERREKTVCCGFP